MSGSIKPESGVIYVPIGIGVPATPINTNNKQFFVNVQLGYLSGTSAPSTTVTLTPYQCDPNTGNLVKPDSNILATNSPQSYIFSGTPSSSLSFSLTTGPQAQNSRQQIVLIASCNGYAVSCAVPIGYATLPQPVVSGTTAKQTDEEIAEAVVEVVERQGAPKQKTSKKNADKT